MRPETNSDDAPGTRVLWSGRPRFEPYLASSFWATAMGLVWLVALAHAWQAFGRALAPGAAREAFDYLLFSPFVFLGCLMTAAPLFVAIAHRRVRFTLTEGTLIVDGGFWGPRRRVVSLRKVSNIERGAGPIERLFGVGTIQLFSGEWTMGRRPQPRFDRIEAIVDHERVFALLEARLSEIEGGARQPEALDEAPRSPHES